MEQKKSLVESMIVTARNHLLDTSFNNRMINSKITLNKGLSFSVEDLNNFYNLVVSNNPFSFLPLENRKKDSSLKSKEATDQSTNKNIDKVGSVSTICVLDTTQKPSLLNLKFNMEDGDSKLLYTIEKEKKYTPLLENIYSHVKKHFTKYGIIQDNIYNKNVIFNGFKRHVDTDFESTGLSLYLAMISLLKNEGIPKNYAFIGGVNEKFEVTPSTSIVEKLTFAYEKGYSKVLISKKNKKDVKTLPLEVVNNVEIVYIANIDEAILAVFDMMNTIELNSMDNEFIVSNKKTPQKVFYVNYNRDDLKNRMDKIFQNSKRHIEEQGINILFLSLAFVQWKNPGNDDEVINSPLVFVPVIIESSNYKDVYKISYSNSEVLLNKSLIKKLELENNIDFSSLMLDIPDESEFNVLEYLDSFFDVVKNTGYDFGIDYHSVHLSFYSYNKFLMYNDLDPQNWEGAFDNQKKNILTDIFVNNIYHEVSNIDDDKNIDNTNEIDTINNVLDADSSQLLAISKVNRGNSIIIQGPPGTGKSQTIVNIIAESVKNNKKVLFMSEKLAAMDVVFNRLRNINLSHIALQLHSDKVNKSQVVRELQSIYYMNKINVKDTDPDIQHKLTNLRGEINRYYELLGVKSVVSKDSLIEAYRNIIELENYFDHNKVKHYELNITNDYLMNLTSSEYDSLFSNLEDLENFYEKYGALKENPLLGVNQTNTLTHHDLIRYQNQLDTLVKELKKVIKDIAYTKLSSTKGASITINEINHLLSLKDVELNVLEYIKYINHPLLLEKREFLNELFTHYLISKTSNFYIKKEILENTQYIDHLEKLLHSVSDEISYFKENDSYLKRRKKAYKEHKQLVENRYFTMENVKEDEIIESLEWLRSSVFFKYQTMKEDPLLEKIFGVKYKVDKEDYETIHTVYTRVQDVYESIKKLFKGREENHDLYLDFFKKFISKNFNITTIESLITSIEDNLLLDYPVLFTKDSYTDVDLNKLLDTFNKIKTNLASLNDVVMMKEVKKQLETDVSDEYLNNMIKEELYDTHISKVFSYIRNHSIVRDILSNNTVLEKFNAMIFDKQIREFVELDTKNIQMNNLQKTLDAHFYHVYNVRKDETLSVENKDDKISYLLQTFNRKHNIPTVKQLLKNAFEPITELKPVFMMSPISISQYLEPIVGMFDVVVFDEASQIKPQDAFGALLRGKQVVVVGDEKQLPPTNFFDSFYGMTDVFKEDEISNYESVLTLLRGSGVPTTTLNWHYRSKHHNLIHISNEVFYDESLSIFPSKYKNNPEYGLKYEYVDGVFDRGRSRTNQTEATKVAKAVINHAKTFPNLSLGVATVNITQRDLILSEVKKLRKKEPELDPFFNENNPEPFFVKNLENVQGDEREVILVSIGYAKDQNGNIIQNFGAINHIGGERRLNVLMTRARRKCVIYSGLRAGDLEIDYNTSEGVKVLRKFFEFAEKNTTQEETIITSDTKVFAVEIAEELHKHGYNVQYNVGNSNYYVDLAIINPDDATEYILGIEFDNSTYIQSRTASERERIRNSVMRAKGWAIYKVYITSWFNNRTQEIEDILAYLKYIEKGNKEDYTPTTVEFFEEPVNVVTRFGFEPYKKYHKMIENINFFVKENGKFNKYIESIIYEEMPVKFNTICDRIVENSHIQIKSSTIKSRVKKAIRHLEGDQKIYINNDFYYYYQKDNFIKFRDRRNLPKVSLSYISDEEFIFAITEIAKSSFGINTEDITSIISNYLGFEGVNSEIKALVEKLAIRLINNNTLYQDTNGNLQAIK